MGILVAAQHTPTKEVHAKPYVNPMGVLQQFYRNFIVILRKSYEDPKALMDS